MEPQPPPRFGVLGPVQIAAPDGWTSPLRGKPTLLLAILLAHGQVSLSKDRLIEALWGDQPPRTAGTALHGYISRLRRLIEPRRRGDWEHLVRDEVGYRLVLGSGDTDADRFEAGIGLAWSALGDRDLYRARDLLAGALGMWRGHAFEGHADHPDVQAEATRLDDLRRTAQEEEVGARIDTGEHHPMVDRARELVNTHPFRERRWGLLMTALYRSGRQAEALETFRTARTFLGEELGIEPSPRLVRLEERILLQDPTLLTINPLPVDAPLPPRDPSLIGRDDDIEHIVGLLSTQRMVSIVGVGGVGKSRVAAAVAYVLRDRRENVWFADLGDLVGDGGVPGLVLNTLGYTEPGEASVLLATALRQYCGVLVLDNCEQVLAGVAGIARHAGPAGLRLLTTSRIPFGVAGESPYELHALPLPESPSPEEITGSEAGRLLLDRCDAGGIRVAVTTETAPLLARLCVLTGGLPLAIELAGGLLRNIPLHVVVEHLEHGPGILDLATADSPRGSITERLNWSLATLDDEQRLVLAGIATFRGGATIEALHAVLTAAGIEPGEIDVAVWHLARRSLVRFDPARGDRYWMLEPIRQLAQAAVPDVADRLHSGHYAYFRSMLTDARAQMESGTQRLWYERIGAEFANLRAMVGHGIGVGDATVIDTAPALADFSHHRGRAREGLALLENMIDRFGLGSGPAFTMLCCSAAQLAMRTGSVAKGEAWLSDLPGVDGPAADAARGRWLHVRGVLTGWGRGDPKGAVPLLAAAADTCLAGGDLTGAVLARLSEAFMMARMGIMQPTLERVREAVSLASEINFADFAAWGADRAAGVVALHAGDPDEAVRRLGAAIATAERLGLTSLGGLLRGPLAWARLVAGDGRGARAMAEESLHLNHRHADGWRVAESECVMGGLELADGNLATATAWFARALRHAGHTPEADGVVWATMGLAACLNAQGGTVAAARLRGHALAVAKTHGVAVLAAPTAEADPIAPSRGDHTAADLVALTRMLLGPVPDKVEHP